MCKPEAESECHMLWHCLKPFSPIVWGVRTVQLVKNGYMFMLYILITTWGPCTNSRIGNIKSFQGIMNKFVFTSKAVIKCSNGKKVVPEGKSFFSLRCLLWRVACLTCWGAYSWTQLLRNSGGPEIYRNPATTVRFSDLILNCWGK